MNKAEDFYTEDVRLILEGFDEILKEIGDDPEKAKEYLQSTGAYNADGTLKPEYSYNL